MAFGIFKPTHSNEEKGGPLVPQFLNRYTYVLNNPLLFTDPTGHEVIEGEIPVDQLDDVIFDLQQAIDLLEGLLSEISPLGIIKNILAYLGVAITSIVALMKLGAQIIEVYNTGGIPAVTELLAGLGGSLMGAAVVAELSAMLVTVLVYAAIALISGGVIAYGLVLAGCRKSNL